MRVPKIGERWLRQDGGSNNIIVIDVNPGIGKPTSTKVRYRYDDGVESEKYLADFHQKFKPEHVDQCDQLHPPTGLRCTGEKGHEGLHGADIHEWRGTPIVSRELRDAVKPMFPVAAPAPVSSPTMTVTQFKAYYGYDKVSEDPGKPKEGNWDDPEYRKRYMGFK